MRGSQCPTCRDFYAGPECLACKPKDKILTLAEGIESLYQKIAQGMYELSLPKIYTHYPQLDKQPIEGIDYIDTSKETQK